MEVHLNEPAGIICDIGRHIGQWRVELYVIAYMSEEEYEQYLRNGMRISVGANPPGWSDNDATG